MEMHQIRYFLALCEELSFTRAARSCGVSQPSLSNGIKALENKLGGTLFTRRPRITVTRLGFAVRPGLLRVVQGVGEVLEVARSLHAGSVVLAGSAADEPTQPVKPGSGRSEGYGRKAKRRGGVLQTTPL